MTADPGLADGVVLHQAGRLDEAAAVYTAVLAREPGNADAHQLLGLIALARGQLPAAITHYRNAVTANPELAPAWVGLGVALTQHGSLEEAGGSLRRALQLQPADGVAAAELSALLVRRSNFDEAIVYARRAATAAAGSAIMHTRLAITLRARYEHDVARGQGARGSDLAEAEAELRRALELQPGERSALLPLIDVLKRQNRLSEAAAVCREALGRDATFVEAMAALGGLLASMGEADDAVRVMEQARRQSADDPEIHRDLLLYAELAETVDAGWVLREARVWQDRFARPLLSEAAAPANTRDPEKRLRVGYVAGNLFRRGSMALGMLPVIERHDRQQIEVFCYSDLAEAAEDPFSRRFAKASTWRRSAGLSDAALAEMIRADAIDVLVDCVQFFPGSRMRAVARRPAPVQIAFPLNATTGGVSVDYAIADDHLVPAGHEGHFAERLLRIPLAHCYQLLEDAPPPRTTRPDGPIVFGSCNWLSKTSPGAVAAWTRILAAVPDSRLLVKCVGLQDPALARRFLERFEAVGIDARRIDIRPWTGTYYDHMATFNEIDIALDTFPYNGVTITCDALWMGVPVVTRVGERVLGRYGLALLHTVGFDEGVAHDADGYVETAIRLARDPARCQALRSELRTAFHRSPVCDGAAIARDLEGAYREAWRGWCAAG